MNTAPTSRHPNRYHRYCHGCGWGFHMQAWVNSQFCPRCGISVKGDRRQGTSSRGPDSKRRDLEVEILLPSAPRRTHRGAKLLTKSEHGGVGMPRRKGPKASSWRLDGPHILKTIREKPLQAAVGGAVIGVAGMVAGTALTAVGAQLATVGGVVSVVSGLIAVGGIVRSVEQDNKGAAEAMAVGLLGTALGAGIVLVGGVISATGTVVSVLGTATVVVSGGLAAAHAWQQREVLAKTLGNWRGSQRPPAVPAQAATAHLQAGRTRMPKRRPQADTAPIPLPKRRPARQRAA